MADSRKIILWLIPAVLAFLPGRTVHAGGLSGYYTEEEVRFENIDSPDDILIRKSWYCGKMMKKDEQWQGITIARLDQDKIYVIDPQIKTYFTITPELLRKNVAFNLQNFGAQKGPDGKYFFPEDLFIRTGTTRQIGNWNCYQVMTNPKYRNPDQPYVVFWYSTEVDFPVQVFGEQLKGFFGDTPETRGLFDRIHKFEGYPVRTETHGVSRTVVTTLVKLESRRDVDPKTFEVPKEYNLVPLPDNMPPPRWGQ